MLPHILKVPLATNPKRLLLVEPPTDLSLLPDELQTVLMGLMMAKEKAQTQSGGEAVTRLRRIPRTVSLYRYTGHSSVRHWRH